MKMNLFNYSTLNLVDGMAPDTQYIRYHRLGRGGAFHNRN